ncbi:MAG: PAS domain-containing protein [Myxococcales bacterium]|nr:PAS domain-containing protein [Myxococcales bacterium]
MSSGVVAIDARGEVVMLNPGAQRILRCPEGEPSDAVGKPCLTVLRLQPTVARLLLETLDGRAALSRAELVLEGVRGELESTIGFTLTPVRDPEGEVCGAAIVFRDLTPFERIDEQQRLHERLAALGQMAAGLAHEIRNPLAGMEIVTGLLKRRLADRDEECSLVTQLQSEVRSLARTVEDCLEFVRPISPERGPVDPVDLVNESLDTALKRSSFSGVIERAFDEELPQLNADVDQLRAVVTNLILNALEAMDGEGEDSEKRLVLGLNHLVIPPIDRSVRVGVDGRAASDAVARQEIVITVSDTGPGVPNELKEKIFYPFFTTKQSGSGVGLATAQKIVAGHGGALELDSEAGRGCSFRVRLPIEDEKP